MFVILGCVTMSMYRSICGHNPCNVLILHVTIEYSKNSTTMWLLKIENMASFVVKYLHMQIIGHFMDLSRGCRDAKQGPLVIVFLLLLRCN